MYARFVVLFIVCIHFAIAVDAVDPYCRSEWAEEEYQEVHIIFAFKRCRLGDFVRRLRSRQVFYCAGGHCGRHVH